jgi:hypothetical protein
MWPLDSINLPNPSSSTMALGLTNPLTEMSTRNLLGGKGRPARKADNLTAICERIFYNNALQPGVCVDFYGVRGIKIRPRIEVLACQKQAQSSQ